MGNVANIKDKGGNVAGLAFITTALALAGTYTAYTDCANLGNIGESELATDTSKEEFKSEDGITRSKETSRTMNTNITLMERQKTLIDFLAFTVEGKTALQYHMRGTVGGYYQEYWSIVQPIAQANIKTPGGASSNKYEAVHIAPDSAVTFTSGAIAVFTTAASITRRGSGSITIAAGQEFSLQETAVS